MNNRSVCSRHTPLMTRSISPSKTKPAQSSLYTNQLSRQSFSMLKDPESPSEVADQLSSVYGSLRRSITAIKSSGLPADGSSLVSLDSYQYLREKQRQYFKNNSGMTKGDELIDLEFPIPKDAPLSKDEDLRGNDMRKIRKSKTMHEESSLGRDSELYDKLKIFYQSNFQERVVPEKTPQIITRQDYLEKRSKLTVPHSISPVKKP